MKKINLKNQMDLKEIMTEVEISKCNKIIHGSTLAISGIAGGLAQIPGSDSAAIAPIQIGMIMALANIFGVNITKSSAGAILANQIAEQAGRMGVKIVLRFIPGVGNVANAAVSAAITETMGWSIAKDFARQKRLNP